MTEQVLVWQRLRQLFSKRNPHRTNRQPHPLHEEATVA